ncbi:tRNA lysidine(34) synthetase TilS [Bacillus paranthracis]
MKAIFIEAKVPREKREEWPVVCDARGECYLVTLVEAICICYLERDSKEG